MSSKQAEIMLPSVKRIIFFQRKQSKLAGRSEANKFTGLCVSTSFSLRLHKVLYCSYLTVPLIEEPELLPC